MPTDPTPRETWRLMRALVIDGLDGYRRQVSDLTGLPFSRVRALRRLRSGELTHAALAEAMMVDRPAATVAVDDLCARGLAVRREHPTDRRCKLVSLTPAGREMAERVESVVPDPPSGWDELAPDELAALARLLDRLGRPAKLAGQPKEPEKPDQPKLSRPARAAGAPRPR